MAKLAGVFEIIDQQISPRASKQSQMLTSGASEHFTIDENGIKRSKAVKGSVIVTLRKRVKVPDAA